MTVAAGLSEPISSESAAWGDYDNDGFLDVYVCGEFYSPNGVEATGTPDPRNRGRLYHNKHDGTFEDVATRAGVVNAQCSKGSAWGDYDGDGKPDLFVSNMNAPCHLYHNEGDGTFRDVASSLGVTGGDRNFACWFWDFDNDGRPDIFVHDYAISLAETVAMYLGQLDASTSRPHLYRNVGLEGFRDVTRDVGLDFPTAPMGCNFGDIDNDGYLDLYFGTGGMSLSHLVPNLMFRNVGGARFEDVTMSSGTGHLQKGHGVSFADYDDDGDLDLFVETGGATPADRAHNLLFQNPGNGRHWLAVRLVGTRSNRAALGAKIRVDLDARPGTPARSVYRRVGPGSSFGGNALTAWIGLDDAPSAAAVTVEWPASQTRQTVRAIPADRTIEITEGVEGYRVPVRRPGPGPNHPVAK
jgi:hypothetical protein